MLEKLKTEFREQIWNNEQVLRARQKFAELDTQTQSYVLIGSFAGFVLILLLTFFTLWGKTISLKNDLARMDEAIRMSQNSSVRIAELKAQERSRLGDTMLATFDASGDPISFADRVREKSLIKKDDAVFSANKEGAELKLNKISLRQLVRALYLIEKSNGGASIGRLNVSTKDDPEGYLWAEILIKKGGT